MFPDGDSFWFDIGQQEANGDLVLVQPSAPAPAAFAHFGGRAGKVLAEAPTPAAAAQASTTAGPATASVTTRASRALKRPNSDDEPPTGSRSSRKASSDAQDEPTVEECGGVADQTRVVSDAQHGVVEHTARENDTARKLARELDLTLEELLRCNQVPCNY